MFNLQGTFFLVQNTDRTVNNYANMKVTEEFDYKTSTQNKFSYEEALHVVNLLIEIKRRQSVHGEYWYQKKNHERMQLQKS